jgi:hypothetical protein
MIKCREKVIEIFPKATIVPMYRRENMKMKRKLVLRLFAVVMAVSLAATSGVPGAALTGIETVYADGAVSVSSKGKNSISVTGLSGADYYTIVSKADYEASGFMEKKASELNGTANGWKNGLTSRMFEGLDTATSYYVLQISAADYNAANTLSLNKASVVKNLGGETDYVTTDGTNGSLEKAVVTLTKMGTTTEVSAQTYTYNGSDQVPTVTVTLDGKTVDPKDYTVTYAYVKDGVDGKAFAHASGDLTNAGTIRVIVSGNGTAYSGTNKTKTYVINKTKVTFSTKAEGGSTFSTAGEAVTATYGSPLQLTVVNNANLPMTFTVPSEYKDYIEVSGDGVLTCKKFTALSSTIPVAVSVASVSNDNYDSTSTAAVYYNVSLAKAASEFAVTNNALTVNTSETEASIAKAIGAKITYKTKSTPTTDEETQTIDLDLGNAKLEYKTNNGVYTTGLPTAEGTYYVRIAYTGTEAGNLTVVVGAEAVTLTISKYAASLAGQGITEEEEPVKTGLVTDETSGVTYLYDENGKLVKSAFLSVDGKTYYANENGEVVKGKKVTVGGKGYVLDKDGVMLTGQLAPTQSGNQVYVGKDGVVVKNKVVTYKGKKYYATATGRIWTDGFKTTKFGNKVYANADGSLKVGVVFTVGKYKYYAGTSAAIATSGLTKTKSGNTVFATASGKLKVNTTFKYKGVKYKANKKGVVKKVK